MKTVLKQNVKTFLAVLIISVALVSCTNNTKKEVATNEDSNTELKTPAPPIPPQPETKQANNSSQFEIVENEKVCMVNDRYMVVKQIPVEADGITYYGCCENCVAKIQNNLGDVRYSKDPLSGNKVDKAKAVIVQNKVDGVVYYFESQASAAKFIAGNS